MTYEEASRHVGVGCIYVGVTPQDVEQCSMRKRLAVVDGLVILGTDVPCVALEKKEVFPEPKLD